MGVVTDIGIPTTQSYSTAQSDRPEKANTAVCRKTQGVRWKRKIYPS